MARAKFAGSGKRHPWAHAFGAYIGRTLRLLLPLLILTAGYVALAMALWLPIRRDRQAVLTREKLLEAILKAKPRPPWIPAGQWRQLSELGLAVEGRSVFQPGLAAELARAYQTSPWIERVGSVRLHYPAMVGVERVVARTPFALVEAEGGGLVVDRRGYVLPISAWDMAVPAPRPATSVARSELPSMTGVSCRRAGAGERIAENEALEGLLLLETAQDILRRSPGALKAVRAQRDPAGTWRVHTAAGPVIEWGYWDDDARPEGEPSTREKKEALGRLLTEWDPRRLRYIRLDQPHTPVAPRT